MLVEFAEILPTSSKCCENDILNGGSRNFFKFYVYGRNEINHIMRERVCVWERERPIDRDRHKDRHRWKNESKLQINSDVNKAFKAYFFKTHF